MTVAAPIDRGERGRPEAVGLGLAILMVAGVLLFTVGLAFGVRSDDVLILLLAILTILVAGVPLVLDQGLPPHRRHLLISLLSIMWATAFGLPPLTLHLFGSPKTDITMLDFRVIRPEDIVMGQVVALLAYGALISGYALPFGRHLSWMLPPPRREWSHGITLGVVAVMVPLGWLVYMTGQFGLIPKRAGSGVLGTLASSTLYGIALLNICYRRYRSYPALVAMLILIPMTMAFNFFTGSKTLFFAPLAMVAISYIVMRRRVRILWIVLAVSAISLFYPVATFYREVIQEGNTKSAAEVLADPGTALRRVANFTSEYDFTEYFVEGLVATSIRSNGLGILSVIVRDTPDRVPYQGGWTLGYIFLSYVPRVLWADKPETTWGHWVTDNYVAPGQKVRSHTGSTWPGELYLNFGIMGVVMGMLMVGTFLRVLHEYVFPPSNPVPLVLLAVVVLYTTLPTLEAGLLSVINGPFFMGAPILIAHFVIRVVFPSTLVAHRAPSGGPARGGAVGLRAPGASG